MLNQVGQASENFDAVGVGPPSVPLHRFGYGDCAAVTAMPATVNDLPFRLTRSPTETPSASAKVRSITTPPGRTQLPAVSRGWSTAAGAIVRPSAKTLA